MRPDQKIIHDINENLAKDLIKQLGESELFTFSPDDVNNLENIFVCTMDYAYNNGFNKISDIKNSHKVFDRANSRLIQLCVRFLVDVSRTIDEKVEEIENAS